MQRLLSLTRDASHSDYDMGSFPKAPVGSPNPDAKGLDGHPWPGLTTRMNSNPLNTYRSLRWAGPTPTAEFRNLLCERPLALDWLQPLASCCELRCRGAQTRRCSTSRTGP